MRTGLDFETGFKCCSTGIVDQNSVSVFLVARPGL